MSAADAREALEAAVRHAMTEARTCTSTGRCPCCEDRVTDALDRGDDYADAAADERIAGRVHDRAIGRARLEQATAEATAERTGRAS